MHWYKCACEWHLLRVSPVTLLWFWRRSAIDEGALDVTAC